MERKQVTNFGVPADPTAQDPRALAYAEQARARRIATVPSYREPVAGGPVPPIPHLDAPAQEGRTMAAQAMPQPQQGIFSAPVQQLAPPQAATVSDLGLLPMDQLPEQAKQDPGFREGQGCMYASAQPDLAAKYGVIRMGKYVPPQQLGLGKKRSAEDTRKDFEAAMAIQAQRKAVESGETKAAQDSAAGIGGAAAAAGNVIGDRNPNPISGEEREKLERVRQSIEKMDEFDFESFRQAMMKDLLNNEDQRQIIESRLEPLSIDDLIVKGYCLQRVPVIPAKFEPTFRSVSAEEDLALKRLIMEDSKSIAQVSDRYLLDKFSLMSIACMLHAVNGRVYPTHLDGEGNFSDDLFMKKFNMILKLPFHMIASIGVNGFWFDVRVRKLFVAEKLKNG